MSKQQQIMKPQAFWDCVDYWFFLYFYCFKGGKNRRMLNSVDSYTICSQEYLNSQRASASCVSSRLYFKWKAMLKKRSSFKLLFYTYALHNPDQLVNLGLSHWIKQNKWQWCNVIVNFVVLQWLSVVVDMRRFQTGLLVEKNLNQTPV